MSRLPIILRGTCYFLGVLCIGFGKQFVDVGAAKLHDYTWADWVVLSVGQAGECFMTLAAFLDKSFAEHVASLKVSAPSLTPADFAALMSDWEKQKEIINPKS